MGAPCSTCYRGFSFDLHGLHFFTSNRKNSPEEFADKTRHKMRPPAKETTLIETNLFLYQLLGSAILMVIPFTMLIGVLWIIIKMGKGFVRSILK